MAIESSEHLSEQSTRSRPAILAMPPELICHVLSYLDTEMLPSIRLICKVLGNTTFEQFVEAYFAHAYCWVFKPADFGRLSDILQKSPTLRTQQVILTDNAFEDQPLSAIHVVRERNEVGYEWGKFFMTCNLHQGNNLGTGHVLAHRVLRDLQDLPQDILVNVDLTNHHHACCSWEFRKCTLQSVLFSITISKTAVSSLTINHTSLEKVDDILAHSREDFMASMSTITSLTYIWEFWLPAGTPVKAALIDIFRSVARLRHLTFEIVRPSNTEEYVGQCFSLLKVPQDLWLAIDLSNLVSLTLRHVALDMTPQELERILAQCRSSLTHLRLSRVTLLAGDEGWKHVGKMLLTMPGLVFVELQMADSRDEPFVQTLSGGNPPGVRLEGRASVVKGLQELAYLGPSLCG